MFVDVAMSIVGFVLFVIFAVVLMRGLTAIGRFTGEATPFVGCGCLGVIVAAVVIFIFLP